MIDEKSIKLANAIAYKKWSNGLRKKYSLDEVRSEAYFGLVKASKTYNKEESKFTSYAYKNIIWTIQQMHDTDKEKYNKELKEDRKNLSLNYEYGNEVTIEKFLAVECKGIEEIEVNDALRPIYTLPRHLLEILVAFYIEGFSQRELAEMLGTTVNVVNNRIMRAKEKLRKEIK